MKRNFILIIIIILIVGGIILAVKLVSGPEGTWVCQNNFWQKHGKPLFSKPINGCGKIQTENIKISNPESDQAISFPLTIEGEARGNWYFEASFPIKLLDGNKKEIASGIGWAKSDWMTNDFVPFEAIIDLPVLPETEQGTLVLRKDNPSGLVENDEEISAPVRFPNPEELILLKIFFNNNKLDPEYSCNKVFPVERVISRTPGIARIALESLLRGPVFKEQDQGFFTSINSGVEIQKLSIENKIAKADFNDQLEFQVGGSCRVAAVRAQIIETLNQFSTVAETTISINGRTEDILQP